METTTKGGKAPVTQAPAAPVAPAVPATPAPQALTPAPMPPKMALEGAVKPADVSRTVWAVVTPADHSIDDVQNPSYLWRRHDVMQPGDRIEIRHQLHRFLVELYVVAVDREAQGILTYPIQVTDFTQMELRVADVSGAVVEQVGGLNWRVRLGNKELKGGFETQLEADAWLKKKQDAGKKRAA